MTVRRFRVAGWGARGSELLMVAITTPDRAMATISNHEFDTAAPLAAPVAAAPPVQLKGAGR